MAAVAETDDAIAQPPQGETVAAEAGNEAGVEPEPVSSPARRTRGRGRRTAAAVVEQSGPAPEAETVETPEGTVVEAVETAAEAFEQPEPDAGATAESDEAPAPMPAGTWAPRRRYEVGPDGKVRYLDQGARPPAPAEEPAPTVASDSDVEQTAQPEAEPVGFRAGLREPAAVEGAVLEAAAVELPAVEPETDEATAEELFEGTDAVDATDQVGERRRRRSRRGGRGRRRGDAPLDLPDAGEIPSPNRAEPADVAPDEDGSLHSAGMSEAEVEEESRPVVTPFPSRERTARSNSALSPLEALVARQNVILDQLLQRQDRMARTMEQTLKSVDSRLRGTDLSRVSSMPRLAIFVDVPNIMYAAERYRVAVDFGKLLEYISHDRTLIRASAYAPISDDPTQRLEIQRFVEPFVNHGYRIVTKPLKRFADGSIKANFDVELAMDILTMSDRLDIVSLVSGDGDFRRLVDIVASKGVRVEVVSFSQSTSAELKAVADSYIDLTQHLKDLCVPVEGDFKPRTPRPRIDISGYYE